MDNAKLVSECLFSALRDLGPRRPFPRFVFRYSILFVVFILLALVPLFTTDRSLIWRVDTLEQVYVWFIAVGDFWRQVIKSFLSSGSFLLPTWNPYWAYGSDWYVALSSFLFDPFFLPSIVTPRDMAEIVFEITVIMRLYCAGLFFGVYCFTRRHPHNATLVGSFMYASSATGLIIFKQGFLINGLWLLPLLLIGSDRMIEQRKPLVLAFVVAGYFILQFYIAYAILLLMIPYCIMRHITFAGRFRAVPFMKTVLLYIATCLLGIGISGFVLIPAVSTLFGSERLTLVRSIPHLFEPRRYAALLTGMVTYFEAPDDAFVGLSPLGFLCLVLALMRPRRNVWIVLYALIFTLCLTVPAIGSLLNGMQYPGSRWSYALTFFACYVCVVMIPRWQSATRRQLRGAMAVSAAYFGVCYLLPLFATTLHYLLGIAGYLIIAYMILIKRASTSASERQVALVAPLVCGVLIFSIVCYWAYSAPNLGNQSGSQVDAGKAFKEQSRGSLSMFAGMVNYRDNGYAGRVETFDAPRNNGLVQKAPVLSRYNSFYNSSLDSLYTSLGISSAYLNYSFSDLDGRYALERLLDVRYVGGDSGVIRQAELKGYARGDLQGSCGYASTSSPLPIASVYERTVSKDSYDSLSQVERMEVLERAAVVDGPSVDRSTSSLVTFENEELAYTAEVQRDDSKVPEEVSFKNGTTLEVDSGDTVEFDFDDVPSGVEVYMVLDGIECGDIPYNRSGDSAYDFIRYSVDSFNSGKTTIFNLEASSCERTGYISMFDSTSPLFSGKKDWCINLGTSDGSMSSASLAFQTTGLYSFKSVKIVALPIKAQESALDSLESNAVVKSSTYTWNAYSADMEVRNSGKLFVSIPYSDGWSLYIDGKKTDIERVNIGFMGAGISSGFHRIEMRYETPGLALGAVASLISLGALAFEASALRARTPRSPRSHSLLSLRI